MRKQALHTAYAIALLLACSAPARAAEAPAGSGGAPASQIPAKAEGSSAAKETTASLRRSCYGGRGARLKPLARQLQQQRAQQALRRQDAAVAVHATRRLLQGGEPEGPLLPGLIKALEARGLPEDRKAAEACAALGRELEGHRPRTTTP